jgi:hypothetical protein
MLDGRHKLFELGPVGGRAGDFFLEYALAPRRRLQILELGGQVLGVGQDTGIAKNHVSLCNRYLQQESH